MPNNRSNDQKYAELLTELRILEKPPATHFDQLERAARVERASILCNAASDLRFAIPKHPKASELHTEAAKLFHKTLHEAYPDGFEERLRELRQGEPSGLEAAVAFLEIDPWFFRSGYLKVDLIRLIVRFDLQKEQIVRLQNAVLRAIDYRDRREFRWYCRLGKKVQERSFRKEVERRLDSDDPGIRRRARWVLSAITHNKTFHLNRGKKRYLLKHFTDAIGDFSRAILLDPGSARAYFWRGVSYARLRKFNEAISDLTMVIESSGSEFPERDSYRHDRHHAHCVRIPRPYADAYRWRGWVYAELGNTELAESDQKSAGFMPGELSAPEPVEIPDS